MPKKLSPNDDPNRIGTILLSYGLTRDQLSHALRLNRDGQGLLGEVCLHLGYITEHMLETAVKKQKARRKKRPAKALVKLATERTKTLSASLGALTAVSIVLADKIK